MKLIKCAIADGCQPTTLQASLFYSQSQFGVPFFPFTYLPVSCHKYNAALFPKHQYVERRTIAERSVLLI